MRRGLSRVELAVILGILVAALALATPAVLRSRDAARKAQTQDNMRRLGAAWFQERIQHPATLRPKLRRPEPSVAPAESSVEEPAVKTSAVE